MPFFHIPCCLPASPAAHSATPAPPTPSQSTPPASPAWEFASGEIVEACGFSSFSVTSTVRGAFMGMFGPWYMVAPSSTHPPKAYAYARKIPPPPVYRTPSLPGDYLAWCELSDDKDFGSVRKGRLCGFIPEYSSPFIGAGESVSDWNVYKFARIEVKPAPQSPAPEPQPPAPATPATPPSTRHSYFPWLDPAFPITVTKQRQPAPDQSTPNQPTPPERTTNPPYDDVV